MDRLISTTREKLLANKIGILSTENLVAWCDGEISRMEQPPFFLIEISMGQKPREPDQLDLVKNIANESDCAGLIEILSAQFKNGQMTLIDLHDVLYKLALLSSGELSHKLHWAADEASLIDQGIKSSSTDDIFNVLHELSS